MPAISSSNGGGAAEFGLPRWGGVWTPPNGCLDTSGPKLVVLDAVRLVGVLAQPPLPVCVVFLVVALEPLHVAFALERQDVRRDAIEEPAIVADDHHAAWKIQERALE